MPLHEKIPKNRKNSDFAAYIEEQLRDISSIETRRMFGSVGLYGQGVFFEIVSGDTLYFKTSTVTRRRYVQMGSHVFQPN